MSEIKEQKEQLVSRSQKDRNQSRFEFLESLQEEYVIAELRSKIYKKPKDKKYWRDRVMKGKREKIESLGERNNITTIFNDDLIKENMYYSIYGLRGYPRFIYRNQEEIDEFKTKDFYSYYSHNSEFRIDYPSMSVVGILKKVNRKEQTAVLEIKDKGEVSKVQVKLDMIQRVL